MRQTCFAAFMLLSAVLPATAQTAAKQTPPPPAIRRWIDLQHVHLSSRFRWFEDSNGVLRSSTLQWQPQIRARFLADQAGRYSLNVGAFSGATLISGWNNTGGGMGTYTGNFAVKQLFVQAEPAKGFEFQVGSLYTNRGEVTENVSYDNDTYLTGERFTWRPAKGRITQVSVMAGYFGEYREPNFFERADRLGDWNYGQALVGFRLHPRVSASVDYIYEDGRDILREGVTIRMPSTMKLLSSIKAESYQRWAANDGAGFNLAGDLRLTRKFTATVGVMSVDRYYGPYNGDRYEVGTRAYSYGTYALTGDLSVGYFVGEAFATDYFIPNNHRFEIIATINPTQTLKRARVF